MRPDNRPAFICLGSGLVSFFLVYFKNISGRLGALFTRAGLLPRPAKPYISRVSGDLGPPAIGQGG